MYNAILSAADLPPKLSADESKALESTACACAEKYAGSFEHWELAAFAAALITPATMRLVAKYVASENEKKPAQQVVAPSTGDNGKQPAPSKLFVASSPTADFVRGAT